MFVVHVASYKWVNNRRHAVVGRVNGAAGWFGTTFPTFEEASDWLNMASRCNSVSHVNGVQQLYHVEIRQCEVESVTLNLHYAVICGAANLVRRYEDADVVLAKCKELADGGDDTMCPVNTSSGTAVP